MRHPAASGFIRILWAAALIGGGFWFADAAIDYFIFSEETFTEALIAPGPTELYMRGAIAILLGMLVYYARSTRSTKQEVTEVSSERRDLLSLFNATFEGILLHDGERVMAANNAAAEILGFMREQLPGLRVADLIQSDFLPGISDKASPGDERAYSRATGIRRDGSKAELEYVSRPHEFNGQPLRLMSIRDVSNRVASEIALRESEDKFRSIFEHGSVAMDLVSEDNVVIEANRAFCELLGYEREELVGKTLAQISHPEDMGLNIEMREKLSRGEVDSFHFEKRYIHKNGNIVWALLGVSMVRDSEGNPEYVIGQMQDITERKRVEEERRVAEEALHESNATLKSTFEHAPIGMALIDPEGKYLDVNKPLCDMLGYSRDELLAKTFIEVSHPDDLPANFARRKSVVKGEIDFFSMEKRYIHKSGDIVWGLLSASVVRDESGSLLYYIGHVQDITRRKRSETGRRRAKELSDALNRINEIIHSTLAFNEITQLVLSESKAAIGAERAILYLRENNKWSVRCTCGVTEAEVGSCVEPEIEPLIAHTERTKRQLVISDFGSQDIVDPAIRERMGVQSYLATPLTVRGEVLGTIVFSQYDRAVEYSSSQIDFANKLAASMSLAIQNANLYSFERHIAQTLQDAALLLPLNVSGLDYGCLYHSATDQARVGGDFYDIFELGGDRVGILIGDVSGKGLEAAAVTSMAKNTIKAYSYDGHSPAEVIAKANEVVGRASAPSTFITLFFAVIERKKGIITYCNAGHPPVLLKRNGKTMALLSAVSPAVGVFMEAEFVERQEPVEAGDTLVLYTDGVTEARSHKEFFGEERLLATVEGLPIGPAQLMADHILEQVREFTKGSLNDDVAVMTISLV